MSLHMLHTNKVWQFPTPVNLNWINSVLPLLTASEGSGTNAAKFVQASHDKAGRSKALVFSVTLTHSEKWDTPLLKSHTHKK